MPPPEQQMAQSSPPVAPASAAGTASSRAGRAASFPAACGLDLKDLMPPLLRPNTRRIAPGMRIAPGIQWYRGSGILPDTCQRRETRNCEVSFSGQPPSGRSPGRAPRRSWRPLLASAGRPQVQARFREVAQPAPRIPQDTRMSPARRPRPRRNHRPAATRPATPGLSGPPRTQRIRINLSRETTRLVGAIRCHSSACGR